MNRDAKETVGCLGSVAALFAIVGFISWLTSSPRPPPMTDAEFRSTVAKMRADRRQRCVSAARESAPYWSKEMQRRLGEVIAHCGDDD